MILCSIKDYGRHNWRGNTDFSEIGMGAFSITHIILIVLAGLLLFGGNKLSNLMGDAAKGIRAFKDGLKDQPEDEKNDGKNNDQPKPPKAD